MQLYGVDRPAARPAGGVAAVELAAASDLASAVYDAAQGCYTSVGGAVTFAGFAFREDMASYIEECSAASGPPAVKHTLTMELPGGEQTRRALERLAELSAGGIAALVTLRTGERLVAGYSPRFGGRFPLRVAEISSGSGRTPADFPAVTVVLTAEDCGFSKPLKG